MDIMIDIETVGTGPNACILTIAAQTFDPVGYPNKITMQELMLIIMTEKLMMQQYNGGQHNQQAQDEAFAEEGRILYANT